MDHDEALEIEDALGLGRGRGGPGQGQDERPGPAAARPGSTNGGCRIMPSFSLRALRQLPYLRKGDLGHGPLGGVLDLEVSTVVKRKSLATRLLGKDGSGCSNCGPRRCNSAGPAGSGPRCRPGIAAVPWKFWEAFKSG